MSLNVKRVVFYSKDTSSNIYWKQAPENDVFGAEQSVLLTGSYAQYVDFYQCPTDPDFGFVVLQYRSLVRIEVYSYVWSTNTLSLVKTHGTSLTHTIAGGNKLYAAAWTGRSGHFVIVGLTTSDISKFSYTKDKGTTWSTDTQIAFYGGTTYDPVSFEAVGNITSDDVILAWVCLNTTTLYSGSQVIRTHDPAGGAVGSIASNDIGSGLLNNYASAGNKISCAWDSAFYPTRAFVYYVKSDTIVQEKTYTVATKTYGAAVATGLDLVVDEFCLKAATPTYGSSKVGLVALTGNDLIATSKTGSGVWDTSLTLASGMPALGNHPFDLAYGFSDNSKLIISYIQEATTSVTTVSYENGVVLNTRNDEILPSGNTPCLRLVPDASNDLTGKMLLAASEVGDGVRHLEASYNYAWQGPSWEGEAVQLCNDIALSSYEPFAIGTPSSTRYVGYLMPVISLLITESNVKQAVSNAIDVSKLGNEVFMRLAFDPASSGTGSISLTLQISPGGTNTEYWIDVTTITAVSKAPVVVCKTIDNFKGARLIRMKLEVTTNIAGYYSFGELWSSAYHFYGSEIVESDSVDITNSTQSVDISKSGWQAY